MRVRSLHLSGRHLAQSTYSAPCGHRPCSPCSLQLARGRLTLAQPALAVPLPSSVNWSPRRLYAAASAHTPPTLPSGVAIGRVPTDVSIWWDVESCPPPSDVNGAQAVNALYKVAMGSRSSSDEGESGLRTPWPDFEGDLVAFRAYGDWATRSSGLLQQFQSQPVTLLDAPYEGASSKLTSDIRLVTDVVAFSVAHNARYTSQAGRRPSRRLRLVLVLGTGDYAYTIQRLQQLGHEVVVVMPRPPPTKADSGMLSMFSPGLKVLGGQLDWQTEVLRPPLTATPIPGFDRRVDEPSWAPFLQRPSTLGRSAIYPSSTRESGGAGAQTFLPLVHALQRQPPRGGTWTERDLSQVLGPEVPRAGTDEWDGYILRAVRAGVLELPDPTREQRAKNKSTPGSAPLALRRTWYKPLIDMELRSYPTVQAAAAALNGEDLPWTDEQSDVAAWVGDPVSVFGPLVELLSEPPFALKAQTVDKVQTTLPPRYPVEAAHVAGDEESYLELAAQAGLLSLSEWEQDRVQLDHEWWPTLYRLTLAALLKPTTGTTARLAGVVGVGGQAGIVTADLARPFIDAVTHFHQLRKMKPSQEQLRRHIADNEPTVYRRAGVGGWDDYIRRLQDAGLAFDDGNKGVSLQKFWYVALVKLELVASGSVGRAIAAEATRAGNDVPWSPSQAKVVDQTSDPLNAFVPFIGQILHYRREGRQIPSTPVAMSPLINPRAYRLSQVARGDFGRYLALAEDAGILSHDQTGGYFLDRNWWSALYRVHLAALARAHGLEQSTTSALGVHA